MTSWTDITNGQLAAGKFTPTSLFVALRDNPIAIAEGDPNAPAIAPTAFRWRCEVVHYDKTTGPNVSGSAGSFTWTCPAGVSYVLIEAVGGGGGGGGGYQDNFLVGANGSAGASTNFNGTALGAGGAGGQGGQQLVGGTGGAGGSGTSVDLNIPGQDGGAGSNGVGALSGYGGALMNPFLVPRDGGAAQTGVSQGGKGAERYGAGGSGGVTLQAIGGNGGGGGGGSISRKVFAVTPTVGYPIVIGAGGAGGAGGFGTNPGGAGGTSGSGGDGGSAGGDGGGGGGGSAGMMTIWYGEPNP